MIFCTFILLKMNINLISQFLFFSGFFVMILNETPVVLRHVYRPAMAFREKMEIKYGKKWHEWHKKIDYIWNFLLFSGLLLSIRENFLFFLSLFLIYWVPIFCFIYLPLYLKNRRWVVGAERFELPTLWSQTRCATRLRYAPNKQIYTL